MTSEPNETQGPVIRDKRRIDPETGEVREPRADAAPTPAGLDEAGVEAPVPSNAEVALAERTADLQRLQAEYVNYKRRVDRDRQATRDAAVASVVTLLLPVLDDIGRAREHGELSGGFKAVAESLERAITGLGLVTFGEVGDEFDPRIHEALMHTYSDDVDRPVCDVVLQVGYRLGDRVVRPARVAVAEPAVVSEVSADAAGGAEFEQGAPASYDGDEAGQEQATQPSYDGDEADQAKVHATTPEKGTDHAAS